MKIAITGAGLIGLASAYFLHAQGHDVVILERRAGPALETSFANAGMLTPSQAEPWNEPGILGKLIGWIGKEDAPVLLRPAALPSMLYWSLQFLRNSGQQRFVENTRANARLARFSLDGLQALRRDENLDYGQICAGTLKVYRDRDALDEGRHIADLLAGMDVQQNFLDAAAAVALEPALGDIRAGIAGAIHFPDDETGDAHRFCCTLGAALARKGVDARYNVEVTGFIRSGRRMQALRTTGGVIPADAFVLCAGSYAPRLGRMLGIKLPIRPVKGYSITIPMAAGAVAPRISVVDETRHAAITPMDGRLRVAGTAEFAGFDTTLTPGRISNLLDVVAEVLPRHTPAPGAEINGWTGLRPYTCDGVPIIGPTQFENFYVNGGHGHLGWTLAVGSGKLLAQIIAGRVPEIDSAPYRLQRF